MQKRSKMASIVASALALGTGIMVPCVLSRNPASAEMNYDEYYYVNNNQVSMTKIQYDSLHMMGFDDYEVANMTEEKFDRFVAIGFIPAQNDVSLLGHITDSTKYRKYEVTDKKRLMETYVSFTKVKSGYKIYVKQNVYWLEDPKDMYEDLLTINYTNNISVAESGNYKDAEMHMRYCIKSSSTYVDKKYTGRDAVFNHKLGEYFGFKATYPKDLPNSSYTAFSFSLEVAFDTNLPNLLGTEIQTYYGHQIRGNPISNWMGLTFSATPPFISFSVDVNLTNPPEFDDGMYTGVNIRFDDAWLSRC